MPPVAYYTPLPRDGRLESFSGYTTFTYTADGAWESGYKISVSGGAQNGMHGSLCLGGSPSIVLGDGSTIYMTVELSAPSATNWNPGVAERIAIITGGNNGPPNYGTSNTLFAIVRENVNNVTGPTFHAELRDANGTSHVTAAYTIALDTRVVLAARAKRYQSGGNWVVDVEIGTMSGSTFTSQQVITGDIIAGADKTITFSAVGGFTGMWFGHPTAYSKGGSGITTFGVVKVNVSSDIVLAQGTAWTQASVDAVNTRIIASFPSGTQLVYVCELITIYDTSASGDSWPTTTSIIDHRLPTSDQSPLQFTPTPAGTHYTTVDDAFGSYSETDYVTGNVNGDVEEFGYPALSLSGKTVLAVGILWTNGGVCSGTLDVSGVISSRRRNNASGLMYAFWDKMPVAPAFPTQKIVHGNQSKMRASVY